MEKCENCKTLIYANYLEKLVKCQEAIINKQKDRLNDVFKFLKEKGLVDEFIEKSLG